MRTVRIATRKSPLALWQANHVRAQLLQHHRDLDVALLELVSEGDKTLDAPLAVAGGKGLFLKELEQALLRGEADLAVHSMKDVTVTLPDGLTIAAICRREDPRDVFISTRFACMAQLPRGALIGTCSLRRQCQIRARFPHLRLANLRGNVNTRLDKLARGEFDGIVLAAAGLKRLGLAHRVAEYLPPELCLPAVGQGAIGVECRTDDAAMGELLVPLHHADTALCVGAERAANERLGGGCHVPLALYAQLHEQRITVRARVGSPDGSQLIGCRKTGPRSRAAEVGRAAAEELLARGAGEILERVYGR